MNTQNQNAAVEMSEVDRELASLLSADTDADMFDDEIIEEGEIEAAADEAHDEVIEESAADDALEGLIAEVEMEEVRATAHEKQAAEGDFVDPDSVEASAEKTSAKASVKATAGVRRESTAGMRPSEILKRGFGERLTEIMVLETSDGALSASALSDLTDVRLEQFDKAQKKVGEKIVNVFRHISSSVALSNYTEIALNLLVEKGEFTAKELRERYLKRPYSQGTANAQAGQMMYLFPLLKIATREGQTLKLNPESLIVQMRSSVTA